MPGTDLQTILIQKGLREHGDPLVPVQGEVRGPFALVGRFEQLDGWITGSGGWKWHPRINRSR
jgi:hypothetical protein